MIKLILDLMERRRTFKNKGIKIQPMPQKVLKAVKLSKEAQLSEKYLKIDMLQKRHDIFDLYKKIKEMTGIYKAAAQYA